MADHSRPRLPTALVRIFSNYSSMGVTEMVPATGASDQVPGLEELVDMASSSPELKETRSHTSREG